MAFRRNAETGTRQYAVFFFDADREPQIVQAMAGKTSVRSYGSSSYSDIRLISGHVSSSHGEIILNEGYWQIQSYGGNTVYNDSEIQNAIVDLDDFVRIGTGKDGVLILFASEEYSSSWVKIPASAWDNINSILAPVNLRIERQGGTYRLSTQSPDMYSSVYVNKKTLSGSIELNEKDVISTTHCRIVFTSEALYVNNLTTSLNPITYACQTDVREEAAPAVRPTEEIKRPAPAAKKEETDPNLSALHWLFLSILDSGDTFETAETAKPVSRPTPAPTYRPTTTPSPMPRQKAPKRRGGYVLLSFVLSVIFLALLLFCYAQFIEESTAAPLVILTLVVYVYGCRFLIKKISFFNGRGCLGVIVFGVIGYAISLAVGFFALPINLARAIAKKLTGIV